MRPQSDLEAKAIGKHAAYHPDSEKGMNTKTIDNRERLIKLCLENGLKLANAMFEKPIEQRITYKPISTREDAPICSRTHDQIDYIMIRESDKITISDCTSDTYSMIESKHYPLLATMKVKFRKLKPLIKATPKYDEKGIWKDARKMNNIIRDMINKGGLTNHSNWKRANEEVVEEQEQKEKKKWKDWIGRESRELILRRKEAISVGEEGLAR